MIDFSKIYSSQNYDSHPCEILTVSFHTHRLTRRRDNYQDDTMKLVGSAVYNDETIN